MISRACFVLIACVAANVNAQLYLRGERFGAPPDNWKQTSKTQFYGYEPTDITGNRGAAGGLLLPTRFFNFYADTALGGSLSRSRPVAASGRLAVERASGMPPYVATAYIGHFSQHFNKFVHVVGISLWGDGDKFLVGQPIVEFSDGTAYAGEGVRVRVSPKSEYVEWSYSWNPGAGEFGYGELTITIGGKESVLDVPSSSDGKDFALDAFGIFQPQFSNPDSDSFLQMYIGNLAYTAFSGLPPSVRIKGGKSVKTRGATVDLKGVARAALGSRIKSVRYRVIKNGKPGGYHAAMGTTNWAATVHVPTGASKIEVQARSDSGLAATAEIRVNRR